tara:strand:- start:4757 stop:5833 length:1077 start_codon:yes stop_codon:yes gene_type:complete
MEMRLNPAFAHLGGIARPRIENAAFYKMRLQRNEKPFVWPVDVRAAIADAIDPNLLNHYPDPLPFLRELQQFIGLNENQLVVTMGIDEAIRSIILLYSAGDDIFAHPPGYAMYDVYGEILGRRKHKITYHPDTFLGPKDLCQSLPDDLRILFLPNPSQPVENCFDLDALRKIADWCQINNVLFVIDEAYSLFGAETGLPLVESHDNVLVLRTFSKAFGAAGLRLGFAAGCEKLISPLNGFRLAHESSSFSLHAGRLLLQNFDAWVKPNIDAVCAGRDQLREQCRAAGLWANGHCGNYVLIKLGDKTQHVVDDLTAQGIFVKGPFKGPLANYILVTCGPPEMMAEFYEYMAKSLNNHDR